MQFLLFFCLLFTAACTEKEPAKPSSGETVRLTNVAYGQHARHKMDVALPANRSEQTPVVVLIHGGAWMAGNKEDMKGFQDFLLQNGIASISINYRYADASLHYAALMEDVHKAVSLCAANAATWGIRNTRFIICGASAGAHLSLLYGYKYDSGGRISGIISMAGPTDLTNITMLNYAASVGLGTAIFNIVGAAYTGSQPLAPQFAEASPVHQLKNIPTLLIHGTADNVVLYSQAEILAAKLQQQTVTYKLVSLPNEGHDLGLGKPAVLQLVTTEIINWINKYGK